MALVTAFGSDDIAELRRLETARCEAVSAGDSIGLGRTLADDYVHVHGTGQVMLLAESVQFFSDHPRRIAAREPSIRLYDDVAVLNGEMVNIVTDERGAEFRRRVEVTQVARRTGDGWRFCSFHATPIAARTE